MEVKRFKWSKTSLPLSRDFNSLGSWVSRDSDSESEIDNRASRLELQVLVCHDDFWQSWTSSRIPSVDRHPVSNHEVEFLCQRMKRLKFKGAWCEQTRMNTPAVLRRRNRGFLVSVFPEIILPVNYMNVYRLHRHRDDITVCVQPTPEPGHRRNFPDVHFREYLMGAQPRTKPSFGTFQKK